MHKIIQIKKMRLYYLVSFEDQEDLKVEPIVYFKYRLKPFMVLEEKTYQNFFNDHLYESYKKMGLNRLKKLQTKKELSDFLKEKGAPKSVVDQIILEFEQKRYLDDDQYTKIFVELKKQQKGPLLLEKLLESKGVSKTIISKYIYRIDEPEIIDYLIKKKIKQLTHKKTKKQIMQKIKIDLMRNGFHPEIVSARLVVLKDEIPENSDMLLSRAYDKARRMIKTDKLSYDDKQKIFKKLYQKGFSSEKIKNMIDTEN